MVLPAAMAGRIGLDLPPDHLNAVSDETPVLVDLKPTGQGYMEDFFAAGGVGAVLRRLSGVLDLDAATVTGERLGAWLPGDDDWIDPAVIRPLDAPVRFSTAAECVRFERESFGALHAMLAGVSPSERDQAWREIEADLRQFEGRDGFEGPCELLIGSARRA